MRSRITIIAGILIATTLMVMALRLWQQAPHIAFDADRPDLVLYAARTTAAAGAVLAQTILILMVLRNIYPTHKKYP
jgi:hypothetical protein